MIRFRVLGALDLRGADGLELRAVLAQPKGLALLVYLSLATPRGFHRRDTLLGLFWPELDAEHARSALRQLLHRLRQSLGDGVVVSRGPEELGVDPAQVWCDAVECEEALVQRDLVRGLELYRGELLPGVFISGAPDFERWLETERARLRDRVATGAFDVAEQEAAQGNGTAAAYWARWAAELTPTDEMAFRRLVQLLARLGDGAGAAQAYDAFKKRLAQEFELEPSPETQALMESVQLASTRDLARATSGAGGAVPLQEPQQSRPVEVATLAPASVPLASQWRWRQVAVPALAVLAVLVAGALVRGTRGGRIATASADAIAVLPFTVRGDPEFGYLQEGMVDLLSAKLDGAVGFRSIDPRAVLSALRVNALGEAIDPVSAGQVAARLGAGGFVTGDIVEVAGRLHVRATLYDGQRGWDAVATASVEGDAQELFELVDDVAGQLLAGRGTGRDTGLTRLAALTTSSLPALKSYLAGERELWAGREPQALSAFLDAIAADSAFALAYYRAAVAARWVSASSGVVDAPLAAARAARLADRLSPLGRGLLSAYREYLAADPDAAEAQYRIVLDGHRENVEAWFMLGETLFHYNAPRGRPTTEARTAFERVLALDPLDAHALVHLARIAAMEGRADEVVALDRRFRAAHPGADRALEMRALRAFSVGDQAEQVALARELERASAIVVDAALAAATAYAQDLRAARTLLAPLYGAAVRDPYWRRLGRQVLTDLPLAQGQWRGPARDLAGVWDSDWALEGRAVVAAEPLFAVPPTEIAALRDTLHGWWPGVFPPPYLGPRQVDHPPRLRAYLVGLLSARLGDTVAARQQAEQLDRWDMVPGDTTFSRDLARGVRAEIARIRGDLRQALGELEGFRFDLVPIYRLGLGVHAGARERFLRAEVLNALRRDEEALQWYGSFPSAHDIVYLAPSHLRRGQVYERMGDRDRAIAHYTRFISLWRECDPEFRPLVAAAEQALARLRASR